MQFRDTTAVLKSAPSRRAPTRLNFVLENHWPIFDTLPGSAPEIAPGRQIFGNQDGFIKFTLPMFVIRNYVLEP
jgi:hypothetical protein